MGRFLFLTAPLAKIQKSGFTITRALAIQKFSFLFEENRLINKAKTPKNSWFSNSDALARPFVLFLRVGGVTPPTRTPPTLACTVVKRTLIGYSFKE